MTKFIQCCLVALVGFFNSCLAFGAEPMQVNVRELPSIARQLLGKKITTHGCLVMTRHGDYVHPCGGVGSQGLTLVDDPHSKGSRALRQLGMTLEGELEGDFVGDLIELTFSHPKPGKAIYLRLRSVNRARAYKP